MNDHLATWAAETATSDEEQRWFAWIAEAQRLAGHNLDGDEREDGYSLDVAHQAFRDGKTARDYIVTIPAAALIPGGNPELSEFTQREALKTLGSAGLRTCGASTWDGNRDDPSYAYCGLSPAHAGPHQYTV